MCARLDVVGELLVLEYRGERSVVLPYSQRRFTVDFAQRGGSTPSRSTPAQTSSPSGRRHGALLLSLFQLISDQVVTDSPVAPGHSYWMIADADAATAGGG